MMRIVTLVGFIGILAISTARAEDRDTIPLLRKTAPQSPQSDSTLVAPILVSPGKGMKGAQAKAAAGDGGAAAGLPRPYVSSIETYGSARINEVALKAFLGKDLDAWLAKGIKGDPEAMETETKLLNRVKEKWGFAQADWSIMEYFEPGDMPVHITLDVVEKNDLARRAPFLPAPTKEFKDPAGLIKAWMDYEEIALDLVEAGQLEPESETCPAFHCPFGHKHPKLKKYEKIFVEGVKKHASELIAIQSEDKRAEWRAAATYLLPYLKDGKQVISLMLGRVKDPDPMVRNNALRVLGDVADYHPELLIPIHTVLEALHFPRVSDRSKAVYVVYLSALNSEQARDEIMRSAIPDLLEMMQSSQPDHKELSQAILRKISGKDFAATDVQAWTNWYNRLPKTRLPSNN